MCVVGAQPGEAERAKNFELAVVGLSGEEFMIWRIHVKDWGWLPID